MYDPNNAPPSRRRAIWAAQAATTTLTPEFNHVQNEARKNADAPSNALPEVDHGSGRGRDYQETVSARSDETGRDTTPAVKVSPNEDKPAAKEVKSYICPKCNREYRRGMYFHQKYCRGL